MALTTSTQETQLHNMGTMNAAYNHIDVTEYASGGFAPDAMPPGDPVGIITIDVEEGYVLQWDDSNEKVKVLGQEPTSTSSGTIALSEEGAEDIGEVKFLVISFTG